MLKKSLFFMAAAIGLCTVAVSAQPLKNCDFNAGFEHWTAPGRQAEAGANGFSVIREEGKNVLQISGGKKEVCHLTQIIDLPPEKLLGKRVNLFAFIKPEKITSGSLQLMIREVTGAGKTIRYRIVKIDKWTPKEWQRYLISLVVSGKTRRLQVYIRGNYLLPEDRIYLKELLLEVKEQKKR